MKSDIELIELVGDTLLVQRMRAEEMRGRIFLPSANDTPRNIGTILATGPDSRFTPGTVLEWCSWAGVSGLETLGEDHLVIDADDVLMLHHQRGACWCGEEH